MSQANGNKFAELEKRLWAAADQLWANSPLRPSEYSTPVLWLIFLPFADNTFTRVEAELKGKSTGRGTIGKADYQARGVVYLPEDARFSRLLQLLESADLGKKLKEAMKANEKENEDLHDVLPKSYQRIDNSTLVELLKIMNNIPADLPGDAFGKIYEYFLGSFVMKEGQKGGEFFTPPSMVDLIVNVIEPFHGRLFDPAIGSGGMVVSSARFVQNHKKTRAKRSASSARSASSRRSGSARRSCAIKSMSGATGRQRVQEACFQKFLVAQPPGQILDSFTANVRPMFKLIQCLARKNANLRRTRDLLLPRLLSGQLELDTEAA